MRNLLLLMLLVLPLAARAQDVPPEIAKAMPDAKLVGTGEKKFMLMDVFTADLYAPGGHWQPDGPMALRLAYHRHLTGKLIADRSLQEMQAEDTGDPAKMAAWHAQMRKIFPDVDEGDAITGVWNGKGPTAFYEDGKPVGTIADPDFGGRFFDIWLGQRTSDPDLRASLLTHTGG